MPLASQGAADMVRAATGLHGDDAGRKLRAELHDGVAAHAPTQDDLSAGIQSDEAAGRLAEIDADDGKLHGSAPSSPGLQQHAITCRAGRGGPSIKGVSQPRWCSAGIATRATTSTKPTVSANWTKPTPSPARVLKVADEFFFLVSTEITGWPAASAARGSRLAGLSPTRQAAQTKVRLLVKAICWPTSLNEMSLLDHTLDAETSSMSERARSPADRASDKSVKTT